jgi:hypothetical protein
MGGSPPNLELEQLRMSIDKHLLLFLGLLGIIKAPLSSFPCLQD